MSHLSPAQTLKLYWQRSAKPARVFALVSPGPSFKLEAWGCRRSYPEMIQDRQPLAAAWEIVELEANDPRV